MSGKGIKGKRSGGQVYTEQASSLSLSFGCVEVDKILALGVGAPQSFSDVQSNKKKLEHSWFFTEGTVLYTLHQASASECGMATVHIVHLRTHMPRVIK